MNICYIAHIAKLKIGAQSNKKATIPEFILMIIYFPSQYNEKNNKEVNIMKECIITLIVGVICIALGISNMKGNISSLHSYHRHRVSEENRIPFAKKVGLGTIICGGSLIGYGALTAIAIYTESSLFNLLGTILLISGLVVGLGLSLYTIIKYNKGIF